MYGRSDQQPGQWSVYAEFTISHPGAGDPENVPVTRTEQNDNSVRMTYSWNSNQRNAQHGSNSWAPAPVPSGTASTHSTTYAESKFAENNHSSSYGFQKGNILFTSTPASRRPSNYPSSSGKLNVAESSGYGSNNYLLSPNSLSSSTSIHQQYQDGRKCRSTCNITLCPNAGDACHHHASCGRSQSLRCQTPSSRSGDYKTPYYGCGDPWCHHLRAGDDFSAMGGRCSPVLETCEDAHSIGERSTSKATRSLSRELGNRKDVSVQTFEMVDKCTSPYFKIDSYDNKKVDKLGSDNSKSPKSGKKLRKRSLSAFNNRKIESVHRRSHSPSSFTPDSLESARPTRSLTRSPRLKRIPQVRNDNSDQTITTTTTSTTEDKSSGSKKPRTVHIDVYCTGTEAESDSTNTDQSDNDTASTPQTVFESEQVKITHKRANLADFPLTAKEHEIGKNTNDLKKNDKFGKYSEEKSDSDLEDTYSTAYPSKLSSYSTMKDYTSSISSMPRSTWTNYSMSSCAVPDLDYDSVANTSWKDNTYSDLDSALQSRSSIAGTESLLFVPRKLQEKTYSIDETPELAAKEPKSPSGASLQLSDSFEYANSEDKLRIRRMEAMWQREEEEKKKKAEKAGAKLKERERKLNEFLQKKLKNLAKKESKESDSDDSTDSGKGWTFVKEDSKGIARDATVRRQSKEDQPIERNKKEPISSSGGQTKTSKVACGRKTPLPMIDQGSLSDTSPSPSCRTPSSVALIQRLSIDPTLRAPFTIAPGHYTEQRNIARKFGTVVNAFKKPGHHVGPVRNPECACAHCTSYYAGRGFRTRTRSMGDPPPGNWRNPVDM